MAADLRDWVQVPNVDEHSNADRHPDIDTYRARGSHCE